MNILSGDPRILDIIGTWNVCQENLQASLMDASLKMKDWDRC